jgi:hypothetical protein
MVGRKCGKLFCDVHTMYQMKLSMSAQWEPVRSTQYNSVAYKVEGHGVEYAKHVIKREKVTVIPKVLSSDDWSHLQEHRGTTQSHLHKLVRKL